MKPHNKISDLLNQVAESTYIQFKPKFEAEISELYKNGSTKEEVHEKVKQSLLSISDGSHPMINSLFDKMAKEENMIKDVEDYSGYILDLLDEKVQVLIESIHKDMNSVYKRFYG